MKNLNRPNSWQHFNWVTLCLLPLSLIYRLIVFARYLLSKPKKVDIPVICVGNVTVGGAGKTPIVIAICNFLQQGGKKVAILSRGYKGILSKAKEATLVYNHLVDQVGDEALMLSKIAPTYINKNRFKSAKAAMKGGAEVIIMDDGLQNYTLGKDFSILVIDSAYGLGNLQLLPAGPLRENLNLAIKKSNCIICTGDQILQLNTKLPIFKATMIVKNEAKLRDKTYIALCGIASPEKFFATLEHLNINITEKFIFGDHYSYSDKELKIITNLAKKLNLKVITTTKDITKIPVEYHSYMEVVDIEYTLPKDFYELLLKAIN